MSFRKEDICICIPTRRPPPVQTLLNYTPPEDFKVLLICDPEVEADHAQHYGDDEQIQIITGSRGMGAQSAHCYRWAATFGYPIFFRMDDDLAPGTFIHKDGHYPNLEEAMMAAHICLKTLDVTLAGFVNTSNRHWLDETGFRRTYGIIHGGANISYSSFQPEKYIDPTLPRCEDIYRTCAHRLQDVERGNDGCVGRVQFIGFDKSKSTGKRGGNTSVIEITREQILTTRQLIVDRFPQMISRLDDEMVRFKRCSSLDATLIRQLKDVI